MSTQSVRICLLVLSLVITASANADVIKTPGQPPQVISADNSPIRGMSKNEVESRFGSPELKAGPVGHPHIYRWDYPEYSVFFENNHVIHSVVISQN